jgi:hypothetical protein
MATNTIELAPLAPVHAPSLGLPSRGYLQPSNPQLVKKVTRVSNPIFAQQELFSEIVGNSANATADFSWEIRQPFDLLSSSTSLDVVNAAQRQTTAIPAFVGLYKAFRAGEKADKIGDEVGKTISHIDKAASGMQLIYALTAIAGRVTALWAAFKPTPAVIAVSSTISKILGLLVLPLYLAFAIIGAYGAKNAYNVHKKYEESDKSFTFLVNSLFVNENEITQLLNDDAHLKTIGQQALNEKGNPTNLDTAISGLGLSLTEEYYMPKLTLAQLSSLDKTELALLIGLLIEIQKKQLCKETALERVIGTQSVSMIKKSALKGLQARLDSNDASARQELDKIRVEIDSGYTHIQRLNINLIVLSTITMVLGIVALANPLSAAIMVCLWTLVALCWIDYDIYAYSTFEGRPGKLDKPILLFSSIVTLIGSAIAIGTAATAGAPLTLALSIALCIILFGVYAYGFHKINRLEEKYKQEQPITLDDFHLHLSKLKDHTPVCDATHALFKKLSKYDRQRITAQTDSISFTHRPFRAWDARGTFAQNYLLAFFDETTLQDRAVDKQQIELLRRATKKAVKHYWTAYWYRETDNSAKAHALQLQKFLRALERQDLKEAKKQYKEIADDACKLLHTQITRVFKRDLSITSLRTATSHLLRNP